MVNSIQKNRVLVSPVGVLSKGYTVKKLGGGGETVDHKDIVKVISGT